MSYNAKNYMEQGGEKWIIGGTLEVLPGASVTGLSADPLLPATDTTLGGVKAAAKTETDTVSVAVDEDGTLYVPAYPEAIIPAANQADSIAEDAATLVTDFNALLAKLKAAGLMAADEE
ncbi:hypothetical protein M670_00693 [Schinkia azotoformans MEV2011]|uniref:Head fiber protein n=1 Tax=Schinkia azotoformans MEV2011 TaxID=1348973 RepID=A0A072NR18_SCHAZ|nr:hypothetical protein [Schinkia azotoformans]KEF39672.1 hypothetical protein M670_00693 [Schinkia azotoformans MEV2011]